MRFLLDENLPVGAAELVAAFGHDATRFDGMAGTTDAVLEATCRQNGCVLITLDLGFMWIPSGIPGVIVLCPPRQGALEVLKMLKSTLQVLPEESPLGGVWIVEVGRIRVREMFASPLPEDRGEKAVSGERSRG